MNTFLVNPYWLFGYDVVFNIVLTFITLAVSYYSYKAYHLSGTKRAKLFSLTFALFSLSYFLQALFGLLAVSGNGNILSLIYFGTYLHLLLFIIGTVTLTYMVTDIEKQGLYFLLLIISLAPLLFFDMNLYLEYVIISAMLGYIFINYLLGCMNNHIHASKLMPAAFGLLFLSDLHLIFSLHHQLFYALGNIIELLAYLLILINLVITVRK